jgi:ATP-dependent DNA helicase RecQ
VAKTARTRKPEPRELRRTLRRFGTASLRGDQERVIGRVLDGKGTLAIMPTGAGRVATKLLVDAGVVARHAGGRVALNSAKLDEKRLRQLAAGYVDKSEQDREKLERMCPTRRPACAAGG